MNGYNKKFDLDLSFGESSEKWIQWLGSSSALVEVKTERNMWAKTGNLAIEYKYKGQPSGIAATASDWWIHVLSLNGEVKMAFIWPVTILKNFLLQAFNPGSELKLITGGDGNHSNLILVPIKTAYKISSE